jgi:5-formyltetrahydrofolate cyclo-ligase
MTGAEQAVTSAKQVMRATVRHRRPDADRDPGHGAALAGNVIRSGLVPDGATVAGFRSLPGEIDTEALLLMLVEAGHRVLLPQTPPPGRPLVFREWRPGMALVRGRFGTMHTEGAIGIPEIMLVPLLAFDARCHRLGQGGGYYDRTIAALPGVRTIGCAFAAQQVDSVPVLPHDAPLDAVATEAGLVFRPEG